MTEAPSLKAILSAALMLLTSACASTAHNGTDVSDPLEPMNRATFAFNRAIDRAVIDPVVHAYTKTVPKAPRQGISNVMRNLREPWVFVNDILQFKFKKAGQTLGRFVLNSSFGLAGLLKVSDDVGIPYQSEDLGQTLATWGVGDGPYLVLPFLGPSNLRDTTGLVGYFLYDPTGNALEDEGGKALSYTRTGIDFFDARVRYDSALDGLYKEDDPYVVARSVYQQNRRFEIHDGNPPAREQDLFDDLEDAEGETPN
ncbi:MlaA family lipoprotein [Kordiimonas marina]|uniref:MlaA family lipoprotein n=1 Tax=Kordiimonas marina TaxID=2872312 RepID=UPI001FF2B163|nr:VacJ family lipoprotein [Kordiimonas marina]MCJ9429381.1 VacJ family lipoprotein [Kordiimonas marina]